MFAVLIQREMMKGRSYPVQSVKVVFKVGLALRLGNAFYKSYDMIYHCCGEFGEVCEYNWELNLTY